MVAPALLAQMRPIYWNPIRSAETCAVCLRPVPEGDEVCGPCGWHIRSGAPLADAVIPLTYAARGSQAMKDSYQYKEPLEALHRGARRRLLGLFDETMERHAWCIADLSPAPRAVTTVPSSSGRSPHPIDLFVERLATAQQLLRYVGPSGDPQARRVFAPERWEVLDEVAGLHVLLVDDTWVSGARMQSCASALKQAGAAYVSAVVLVRHLDEYGAAPAFLEQHKSRRYDPAVCPVTGQVHD